jgi:Fe-S-cluster containining protein
VSRLHQIQATVHARTEAILSTHAAWPCRKGCDECCRRLASVPRISREEWQSISATLDTLPPDTADLVRRRIHAAASASRPIVCPLLDAGTGSCLVYEARPIACRAYGFYAERESVLGCNRIASLAEQHPNVIWGNHAALEEQLRSLGDTSELWEWSS